MFLWQIFVRDNIGKKFGRWTVVKYVGKDLNKRHLVECLCECGKRKNLDIVPFRTGVNSSQCNTCARARTYYADKEFKSIYSRPFKMHASEEEDIMDYYNDFSHKYYRDENN